jgi:hypothetical protein
MAFRTNYRFERVERDRVKKAKKEEKVRKRQERGAVRGGLASMGGYVVEDGTNLL